VHVHLTRRLRSWLGGLTLVLGLAPLARAQVVACDFDVSDNEGINFYGSTAHLTGRAGASTIRGQFFIINANSAEMDVDSDGYATACDYPDLYVPPDTRINLTNVANPALAIPAQNISLVNLPHILLSGQMARVELYVEVPPGTPAGVYRGEFQVRDRVRGVTLNPEGEILGLDRVAVEVTVLPDLSFSIINADTAKLLDSLVLRARAGQRASGVFRVANQGNAPLNDVRFAATDLTSESAVGLIIPKENVTFSVATLSTMLINDTARVTVTVQVPRGILGGRYRGTIIVQGQGTASQQLPLVVIVTSSRGILFENNPVRSVNGDIGRISFNADPGTEYQVAIFDMNGLLVYTVTGTVFAGVGGTAQAPTAGADFAVSVPWPLGNGRGEAVASGMYVVVVQSIVNGQLQLARDRLMVIR
jgi:hypothetical protein